MDAPLAQRTSSLYVGDLPVEMNNPEEVLGRLFGSVGPVASIRVCRDMNTQRSLGYAYVNFQNPADAEKAIESFNYTDIIPGHSIRIMPSMRDPILRRAGINNLYVKIADRSLTARDLRDIFSRYGKILSTKVTCDTNGKSLGYGFVQFETAEGAKTALEKSVESLGEAIIAVAPFVRKAERLAQEEKKFVNVYVKNIKPGTTEDEIRGEFNKFGELKSLFLSGHPQHQTMFCILSFLTHDAAVAAIEAMHNSVSSPILLPDSKLFVCRALKKRDRQEIAQSSQTLYQSQGRNLYIKHLDESVTREKLEELFSPFGKIVSCVLMKDASGVSREFGFVCFEAKEIADTALREMNGKTVFGKPLYVSYAEQKDMRSRILHEKIQRMIRQQHQRTTMPMTILSKPWTRNYPANSVFRPPFMQPFHARRQPPHPPPPMFMTSSMQTPPPPPPPVPSQLMNHGTNRTYYTQPHFPVPPLPPPPPPPPPIHSAQQVWQGANGEALRESHLSNLSPEEKRNILGERLFSKVMEIQPNQAAKITGMLLEMETAEILEILNTSSLLTAKVEEAIVVLRQHTNRV
ncbi:putative poly(A)-binding protein [Trypanosoma theileri]|uniref:Putative poly(A)-binding protein n=1 Tax=Trypanosoma theileri TaxID=67003 RepID=A0A1X0P4V5_9TRYP|nr:putative poly(A)-binding protein [Trypanosoma theileri]ORC91868.1 putative poly(A)-binding protein [Trypanosoma theileri]